MGGLHNRNVFSHSTGGWKSKVMVLTCSFLLRSLLPASRWLPSCCVLTCALCVGEKWREALTSFHTWILKTLILWDQGHNLGPHLTLITSLKTPSRNTQKESGLQHMNLWGRGHKHLVHKSTVLLTKLETLFGLHQFSTNVLLMIQDVTLHRIPIHSYSSIIGNQFNILGNPLGCTFSLYQFFCHYSYVAINNCIHKSFWTCGNICKVNS